MNLKLVFQEFKRVFFRGEAVGFIHKETAQEKEQGHPECDKYIVETECRGTIKRKAQDVAINHKNHRKTAEGINIPDSLFHFVNKSKYSFPLPSVQEFIWPIIYSQGLEGKQPRRGREETCKAYSSSWRGRLWSGRYGWRDLKKCKFALYLRYAPPAHIQAVFQHNQSAFLRLAITLRRIQLRHQPPQDTPFIVRNNEPGVFHSENNSLFPSSPIQTYPSFNNLTDNDGFPLQDEESLQANTGRVI